MAAIQKGLIALLVCVVAHKQFCEANILEEDSTPIPLESGLPRKAVLSEADGLRYLQQFGYVGPDSNDPRTAALTSRKSVEEGLRKFQRTAGIPVTGVLDDATKNMMSLPRCGVKDGDASKRMKRYAISGSKWDHSALTYKINSFTDDIPNKDKIRQIFKNAFQAWSDVTPLTFTKSDTGSVDIDIEFTTGDHGDGNPFDGPGQALAHAFFPIAGGDAHFDDDEHFTDGTHQGINLFQVAVHEFGHSLGLGHSEDKDALMAPFYRGYVPNFNLHKDDIEAIQALYGAKPKATTASPTGHDSTIRTVIPTSTLRPTAPTGACSAHFDAVAHANPLNGDAMTWAFSGETYYILIRNKINTRNIKNDFRISERIDAAIALNGRQAVDLLLFVGDNVHWYKIYVLNKDIRLRFRQTQKISSLIRGLPDNIDAIFRWSGNNNVYAFKGKQYYRITGSQIAAGYPRSTEIWNLPDNIDKVDAVVQENGWTYFFVGQNYYRYMDRFLQVADGYPRNIGENWLKCQMSSIRASDTAPLEPEVAEDDGIVRVKTALQLESESAATREQISASTLLVMLLTVVTFLRQWDSTKF